MQVDLGRFGDFFGHCTSGLRPYPYQERVHEKLSAGRHLEIWAPTGSGKTLAALVPFLRQALGPGPRRWDRLIYVLPLRSLVESIAAEAARIVTEHLGPTDLQVRIQTGERPDDSFFSEGDVIVTTYDQLLSGALEGPYGLPDKLHNINAAAVAGALVVFDEYHLMQPDLAFLTAVAQLELYRSLCQSVWMTATATTPLRDELMHALDVELVRVKEDELRGLPSVADVRRQVFVASEPLTAAQVLEHHTGRSIGLVNTVARADALYEAVRQAAPAEHVILLHSRFLASDRQAIEKEVRSIFGRSSTERCILVCTQVIEAGMDLSCDVLHTEAAPMNALVQRAGRCARFPGEVGRVFVYPLPTDGQQPWLPYQPGDVDAALAGLGPLSGEQLDPTTISRLVEAAHREADELRLRAGFRNRQDEVLLRARQTAVHRDTAIISDLIRADDGQTIRVVLAREPGTLNPYAVEGFGLGRWSLARLFEAADRVVAWRWTPADEVEWTPLRQAGDLGRAFAVCLHPAVASYSSTTGLRLGQPGTFVSPPRTRPGQRGRRPLRSESWARHAREVGAEAARLAAQAGAVLREGLAEEPWGLTKTQFDSAARTVGLIHDVGKLQAGWQDWAERAQRSLDAAYVHRTPLAHTDFDPNDRLDREREWQLRKEAPRPPHAAASAFYAARAAVALLREAGEPPSPELLAACLCAVLGHHGAGLEQRPPDDLRLQPLVAAAGAALREAAGDDSPSLDLNPPPSNRSARATLHELIDPAAGDDAWPGWWPFAAWLTRVLRLADQRATAAYGGEE